MEKGDFMRLKIKSGGFYGCILELPLLLLCGGVGYYGIETLFRGYSHWSMAICGAICFLGIYRINERWLFLPLWVRATICAGLITSVELAAGCILNLWLGLGVWNYSEVPLNLWGQICLPFFVLWFLLSLGAAGLCRLIRKQIFLRPE